ncbi:hypothetical protein A4X13_0g1860 [Tilletia indica]|uniref:Uncharacterized protein n=1 Tax=Tilletia indica TaxID=43049 RepID=A0A177TP73_9BASI|nr:hypothetical protein A4X13_0g1860 [Tilletia indica]
MTDAEKELDVYQTELEVKVTRSDRPMGDPVFATPIYLASVHSAEDRDIDAAIIQHNRDFPQGPHWRNHLVTLSKQFKELFDPEQKLFYKYDRCCRTALWGVKMFDDLRAQHVMVRSISEFRRAFDAFGGSVLKGLDWGHVGVAGGSILACLTQVVIGKELRNSDIDLFIWGLNANDMANKLNHILTTIEGNVDRFPSKYMVERSATAVTLVPRRHSAGRRIQVILRVYTNPAAILSSFDIDPACILYDGQEVWLSLRAVRAFYTGYTTTTGSISSSFAARIVKYATRGYGVLVRPDEDEEAGEELLRYMETTLRRHKSTVVTSFSKLPWTGTNNFKKVFAAMKSTAPTDWTHSYSALAALASLWHFANMSGRIGELMDEVGAASNIYGLYEGYDAMNGFVDSSDWLRALETFSPSLKSRTWTLPDRVWKIRGADLTNKPLLLIAILPILLRQHLHTRNVNAHLHRLPDSDDLEDADGTKMEICLWSLTGHDIWQQPVGQDSAVHELLVTATMLTAWTLWKISSGASWPRMGYGRSLHNALVFSFNAALTRTGDFDDWIRS